MRDENNLMTDKENVIKICYENRTPVLVSGLGHRSVLQNEFHFATALPIFIHFYRKLCHSN